MGKKDSRWVVVVILAILIVLCVGIIVFLKIQSRVPALVQTNITGEEEIRHSGWNGSEHDLESFYTQLQDFTVLAESDGADDAVGMAALEEQDNGEYLCSFSSERRLTQDDIYALQFGDYDDLPEGRGIIQMVVNEMYARYGYQFNNQEIQAYFEQRQWYREITNRNSDMDSIYQNMTDIEKANIELLSQYREG